MDTDCRVKRKQYCFLQLVQVSIYSRTTRNAGTNSKKQFARFKMKKLSIKTTESDLLRARKEGLERARSLEAMQALGKWKSMDVFAWANPHFDALTTVISNFPFPVVWIGKQSQIKCAVRYYPEVLDTVETVVVSDFGSVKLSGE